MRQARMAAGQCHLAAPDPVDGGHRGIQTALHPLSTRVESARLGGCEVADSHAELADIHQTFSVTLLSTARSPTPPGPTGPDALQRAWSDQPLTTRDDV